MLKQKIKIDASPRYDNIEINDFYLSPDLDFVSGTTSSRYGLVSGSMVRYQANSGNLFYESPLDCHNVIRQGVVTYNGVFPINRETYYGKDITYVEYMGKVFYVNDGDVVFDIDDYTYIVSGITEETEEISVPVKSYIENGTVNIDGNVLAVDVSYAFSGMSDESDSPMFKYNYLSDDVREYNEEAFNIDLWPAEDWKVVTKFVLRPDDNILLNVSSKHIIRTNLYINVGTETFPLLTDEPMSISGAVYVDVNGYRIDVDDFTACDGVIDTNQTQLSRNYVELWDGSTVGIKSYDEEAPSGDKIAIVLSDQHSEIPIGSRIIAKSTYSDYIYAVVETDHNTETEYIVFGNSKYDLIKNDYVTVTINGREYQFLYINEELSSGVIEIGEHIVPLRINGDKAERYWSTRFDEGDVQYYDPSHVSYDVSYYDSVVVDGEKYKVDRKDARIASVTLTKQQDYEFMVESVSGASTYYLTPVMMVNTLSGPDTERRRIQICNIVGSSEYGFVFYLKNTVLGDEKITFKKVFDEQMEDNPEMKPISSDDVVSPNDEDISVYMSYQEDFKNSFFMYKIIDYYSVPLLLTNTYGSNLMQENTMVYGKLKEKTSESISPLVDMEKDVYFPYINDYGFADKIEFNVHLRTRDLNAWKVNENDENPFFTNDSNWNITDCGPYRKLIDTGDEETLKKMMRSSDLVYFLKFTDDDIERQKMKIEKTFLRLSFYNSPDATNQYLLGTSTIFLDEGGLYWKYSTNQNNGEYVDVNLGYESDSIGVSMEPIDMGEMTFDNEKRISSQFTVVDKNKTVDSSEGFYIYMFKEYSGLLHERDIYMTVDLYHAGLGKKIPLYLPMHPNGERLLTLSKDDVRILKNGIPLNTYYEQLYIPLKCKYLFDKKRYIYYLDDKYVFDKDLNDGTIVFNLFELKIGR